MNIRRRIMNNMLSARNYIQDGLVLHFDGIENSDYNVHDSNASDWTNLVNRNYNATGNNVGSWADNCWTNSASVYAPFVISADMSSILDSRFYTVEMTLYTSNNNIRQTIFGNYITSPTGGINFELNYGGGNQKAARFYNNGKPDISVDGVIPNNNTKYTITWVVDYTTNKCLLYINGVLKKTYSGTLVAFSSGTRVLVIGGEYSRALPLKGGMYSLRLYNRILTENEIIYNNNLDDRRFLT